MHVAVVTPPEPFIRIAAAKEHCNIFHDDDDGMIEAMIAAATAHLDGPNGWLNRSLGQQGLLLTLDGFPERPLALPLGPVLELGEITYISAAGVVTTLTEGVGELTADGRVRPAYGQCWPTTRSPCDPVTIAYTAGHASVPTPLRQAILLMVGDLYANRESGGVGSVSFEFKMPTTVEALCLPYRRWTA